MAGTQNFRYSGINRVGERVSGTARAVSEQELELRLIKQEIDPISIKPDRSLSLSITRQKVRLKDIVALTMQLQQLLRSGLSLMDILSDMSESTENLALREVLADVYDQMAGGKAFSEALEKHPKLFDQIFVYLVRVGEQTGNLEQTLAQLAEMKKWQDELQSKAKKIMTYPAILVCIIVAVFLFMMTLVVPDIVSFVVDMGGEISPMTQSLISTSEFINNYWYLIIAVPVISILTIKYLHRNSVDFRLAFDRVVLKVPLFGEVIKKIKLARMANTIGVMYSSGIALPDTLKMVRKLMKNGVLERAVDHASQSINDGRTVHESFQLTGEFPPLVIRMLKVGESSGRMDEAMQNISYFYDREAKETIERIEPAIEPILTLAMAAIIGWIMMAVLGPIYDIITQI